MYRYAVHIVYIYIYMSKKNTEQCPIELPHLLQFLRHFQQLILADQ